MAIETVSTEQEPEHRARVRGKARSRFGSPLCAMRKLCVACMGDNAREVRLCPALECDLWVYRFGKRPATAARHGEMVDVKRAAELGWVEQAEELWQEMKAARQRKAG